MNAARDQRLLRQLAAGKEMSAAEREEALALFFLQVDRHSLPPITAATKKSLKDLLEAVSDLDGAARVILGTSFVEKLKVAIKSCLDSLKITRGHDLYYRLALQHLIKAWWITHGRSPLTESKEGEGGFEAFQKWAGAIMEAYGKSAPGKHIVALCLTEPVDRRSDMRLNPPFTRFP
jgi:hypothetical protein